MYSEIRSTQSDSRRIVKKQAGVKTKHPKTEAGNRQESSRIKQIKSHKQKGRMANKSSGETKSRKSNKGCESQLIWCTGRSAQRNEQRSDEYRWVV